MVALRQSDIFASQMRYAFDAIFPTGAICSAKAERV